MGLAVFAYFINMHAAIVKFAYFGVVLWHITTGAIVSSMPRSSVNAEALVTCLHNNSPDIKFITDPTDFENARIGVNFRYDDFYPVSIVNVTSIADIQAAVVCARSLNIELVAMNGGHSFEGASLFFKILAVACSAHDMIC